MLITARVAVAPEHREAYLDTVARMARLLEASGQHLWVFESREMPGQYLEFSEGPDDATHRHARQHEAEVAALEAELTRLATYDASRRQPWDELALRSR